MTTDKFIEEVNTKFQSEGKALILEFLITFSRFECALKASGFYIELNYGVESNWNGFIKTIKLSFNAEKTNELKEAVQYLLTNPPKVQFVNNGVIGWKSRKFDLNESEIKKLGQSIRDVRNNLFHGGKFNGNYQKDVSRNYILLKNVVLILNEFLELNTTVKENFTQSIE